MSALTNDQELTAIRARLRGDPRPYPATNRETQMLLAALATAEAREKELRDRIAASLIRETAAQAQEKELRAALESVIRLTEPIPHSVDVEQAGMQAEVAITAAHAALRAEEGA